MLRVEDSKLLSDSPSAWLRLCTSPTDTELAARVPCSERSCEDSAWLLSSRMKSRVEEALWLPETEAEGRAKKLSIAPETLPSVLNEPELDRSSWQSSRAGRREERWVGPGRVGKWRIWG